MLLLIYAQMISILEDGARLREGNAQVRQENKRLRDEIAKLEAKLADPWYSQEISANNSYDHVTNDIDSVRVYERCRLCCIPNGLHLIQYIIFIMIMLLI